MRAYSKRLNKRFNTSRIIMVRFSRMGGLEVLLILEPKDYLGVLSLHWGLPGGKVQKELETSKECALREFFEEVGIRLDEEELKFSFEKRSSERRGITSVYVCFMDIEGTPRSHELKIEKVQWFPISTLPREGSEADGKILLPKHLGYMEKALQLRCEKGRGLCCVGSGKQRTVKLQVN